MSNFQIDITVDDGVTQVDITDPSGFTQEQIEELAGDKNYVHSQDSASDTWNVNHGLGKKPSVIVVDSADNVVFGDIEYIDEDNIKITFSSAFAGKAYLN